MQQEIKTSGFIHKVSPAQQTKNGKTFREVIITDNQGNYPQYLCFTFWDAKEPEFDELTPGDEVEITGVVSSREYNGRYFTGVRGNEIKILSGGKPKVEATPPAAEYTDDIPF